MPPTPRRTPQRTVAVDDELWEQAMRIAKIRREKLSEIIRRAIVEYVEQHKHLDEQAR